MKDRVTSHTYISKINSDCEKQKVLLMIPNGKKKVGIILQ